MPTVASLSWEKSCDGIRSPTENLVVIVRLGLLHASILPFVVMLLSNATTVPQIYLYIYHVFVRLPNAVVSLLVAAFCSVVSCSESCYLESC